VAKVQYHAAASLDGFIARPDGAIDWLQTYGADADLGDGPLADGSMDEFYDGLGALVMGSATYEWVLENAKEWPYDLPTWVFTSRDLPEPPGIEVNFANGESAPVREAALESANGKDVWLIGGGKLASTWADEGLIDEITVTVVPTFIGEGLPFFARAVVGELRHAETKTHGNGMVSLTFRMPQ
jgi:dihydrofolate reductase